MASPHHDLPRPAICAPPVPARTSTVATQTPPTTSTVATQTSLIPAPTPTPTTIHSHTAHLLDRATPRHVGAALRSTIERRLGRPSSTTTTAASAPTPPPAPQQQRHQRGSRRARLAALASSAAARAVGHALVSSVMGVPNVGHAGMASAGVGPVFDCPASNGANMLAAGSIPAVDVSGMDCDWIGGGGGGGGEDLMDAIVDGFMSMLGGC
ncbi:hypothetical protein GGF31_005247 [Allomyces arbusculus]|nr:hypothetical protein GGF31_005247 [Allomyces arbusculus]